MLQLLQLRLREVVKAVAPLVAVVTALQFLVVGAPTVLFLQFLLGSTLAILGMLLLFTGVDLGIVPMGRFIGAELPRKGSLWLIVGVGFAMGMATTLAEPDVLVLAAQVEAISDGATRGGPLIAVIAAGVGVYTALGLLRIVWGLRMTTLLAIVYSLMIALSFMAPVELIPLAYDAGSVTTGVLTAPVVLALALGLSTVLAERSAINDGFGLLGLASAGPIVAVLLLGMASC